MRNQTLVQLTVSRLDKAWAKFRMAVWFSGRIFSSKQAIEVRRLHQTFTSQMEKSILGENLLTIVNLPLHVLDALTAQISLREPAAPRPAQRSPRLHRAEPRQGPGSRVSPSRDRMQDTDKFRNKSRHALSQVPHKGLAWTVPAVGPVMSAQPHEAEGLEV